MRLRAFARLAVALLPAVASSACVGGSGLLTEHENVTETRALDAGGRFDLENVNGRVTVATWDKAEVRIEAEKAASNKSALADLRVEVDGEGSRVKVRTRHRRKSWLFGGGGKVDYRITVPVGAEVSVENVNGSVAVEGVSGEVRVSTTNGGVEVTDAGGRVQASSVNGSVTGGFRALAGERDHRFSTVNGSITVSVPEGTGGRLEAQTVNGSVDNALHLASTERSTRRRLAGRLGEGHGSLEASTVNGSIWFKRN